MSRYRHSVYVDVDLDEFDDEDIIAYIESRGYTVRGGPAAQSETAKGIYELLAMRAPNAEQKAKEFIADMCGRMPIQ